MVDIQSAAAEIRRGKKKKNKPQHENIMVSLFHRATITIKELHIAAVSNVNASVTLDGPIYSVGSPRWSGEATV